MCDFINEIIDNTREQIFENLIAKANRAAAGKPMNRPEEANIIATMIGDETAGYLKWIALMLKDKIV